MGCIFGCNQPDDDDELYMRDNRHHYHDRTHRRVIPRDNYCLICRCQQYSQRHRGSNQCFCVHSPGEHKRI